MRTSVLAVALASALLIVGAGGAFAATSPLQPQQSATSTGSTTTGGGGATTAGASTATVGASTGTSAGTATESSGANITFDDQESSGETVLIRSATLSTNGFVVINGTSGGSERVLGSSYLLNAGLADNVRIQLDQPLNDSESLTAVLYADSNGNGAFDADADEPVHRGDSDRRVVDIADVTVQGSDSGTAATTSAGTSAETAGATSAGGAETTAASGEGGASTQSGGSENTSGGNASGESTSSNGPGFGAVVAVVALLGVALLARRR